MEHLPCWDLLLRSAYGISGRGRLEATHLTRARIPSEVFSPCEREWRGKMTRAAE